MEVKIVEYKTGKIDKNGRQVIARGKFIKFHGRLYPILLNEQEFITLDKDDIVSEKDINLVIKGRISC